MGGATVISVVGPRLLLREENASSNVLATAEATSDFPAKKYGVEANHISAQDAGAAFVNGTCEGSESCCANRQDVAEHEEEVVHVKESQVASSKRGAPRSMVI